MNKNNKIEKAILNFKNGYNCCQSIFYAYAENYNVNIENIIKISSTFGGGMGEELRETCGVITGALMFIGLKYGKSSPLTIEEKFQLNKIRSNFIIQFKGRNTYTMCKDLVNSDIQDENFQLSNGKKIIISGCSKLVKDSAEILSNILLK